MNATRVVRFVIGACLLAYATWSFYLLFAAFRGASGGVEGSGILLILTVAFAVTGAGLVRQSIVRVPRSAVGTYSLYLFGYGWLLGVLVSAVVTQVRRTGPTSDSPYAVALDVFSWLVVTLILAIPGLISLTIARRA